MTPPAVSTISPSELNRLLAGQPGLPVLDVRTPGEFAAGHVPQARNLPLDLLDSATQTAAGVPLDQPFYLLCAGGGRARRAAEQFARAGFTQPVVIEGGTSAWEKAGLPLTRGAGGVISLERQIRIAAGALVVIGVVLARWVDPAFLLLSGIVGAGLVFAGITDWCGMGLLLAKLPWNRRSSCGCGP